jgi:hypothetical protein
MPTHLMIVANLPRSLAVISMASTVLAAHRIRGEYTGGEAWVEDCRPHHTSVWLEADIISRLPAPSNSRCAGKSRSRSSVTDR